MRLQFTFVGFLVSCSSLPELPRPKPLEAGSSLTGEWESSFGRLRIDQRDTWIIGTHDSGGIYGRLKGNQLLFNWKVSATDEWGKGYFLVSENVSEMKGKLGTEDNYVNRGTAWARRAASRAAAAEPASGESGKTDGVAEPPDPAQPTEN